VATQVRVATKALPQDELVTVLRMDTEAEPQVSLATGVSKVRLPPPHWLVLLPEQVIDGALVSTLAMVWLHLLVLPHWSVATQVRVATKALPQVELVNVLRMDTVGMPQLSLALGESKVRLPMPHWLVLFPTQVMVGGVVSTKAPAVSHSLVLPLEEVTVFVRVKLQQLLAVTTTLVWSVGPTMEAQEEPIVHRIVEPGGGVSM